MRWEEYFALTGSSQNPDQNQTKQRVRCVIDFTEPEKTTTHNTENETLNIKIQSLILKNGVSRATHPRSTTIQPTGIAASYDEKSI